MASLDQASRLLRLLALSVSGLFALLTGAVSLRTRGVYFIMITMAFSQMAYFAFVVVIIGGIGSVKGAFYAALMLGLIDTLSRSYLDLLLKLAMPNNYAETAAPAVSAMLVYILMAAVLAFRPQGLFPPAGAK